MIAEKSIERIVADKINCFGESKDFFSKTRDVFTARIQVFISETKKYLEAAIIGEIGNNTFDHNFAFRQNTPWGLYCNFSYGGKYTVLADFGRGIRQSLSAVVHTLDSDVRAIETAFTKRISGRSPEQRGNGLKFVAETIQQNGWHLFFQSGTGACAIDKDGIQFTETAIVSAGCLAILDFGNGA